MLSNRRSLACAIATIISSSSTTLAFTFHTSFINPHNHCNPCKEGEDCIRKYNTAVINPKAIFGRRQRHRQYHNSKLQLASSSSSSSFDIDLDDLDLKAQAAAEAWDVYVTPFVTSEESSEIEKRLGNRADVSCIRIGGGGSLLTSTTKRSRFLFTNPDLGMDESTANQEYVNVLEVDNISGGIENLDPWPNILRKIGIQLNQVGDIYVSTTSNTAYLIVDPEIAKVCIRLLPKELPGAVTVSTLHPDEDTLPDFEDLDLQDDMEIKRLDKREQKRK